jgi:hypothetical protein
MMNDGENRNWFIHHHNVPAYATLSVPKFLATGPHSSYLPSLVFSEFFLLMTIKLQLYYFHCQDTTKIQEQSLTILNGLQRVSPGSAVRSDGNARPTA